MNNVAQHLLHVACHGGVGIGGKCGYQHPTAQKKFHELLETHKFHGRTTSWLVSVQIIRRQKVHQIIPTSLYRCSELEISILNFMYLYNPISSGNVR